jgi:hypothetical protein
MKVTKCLNLINSVSNCIVCRQIFENYNILTLSSLYTLEVICFIIKYKNYIAKKVDILSHNMQRKLNLHM